MGVGILERYNTFTNAGDEEEEMEGGNRIYTDGLNVDVFMLH